MIQEQSETGTSPISLDTSQAPEGMLEVAVETPGEFAQGLK